MDGAVVCVDSGCNSDCESEGCRGREIAGADIDAWAVGGGPVVVDVDEESVSGTVAAGKLNGHGVSLEDGDARIWIRGLVPGGNEADECYGSVRRVDLRN